MSEGDSNSVTIDPEIAWKSVLARDRGADGLFVTGVLTTGIYCRPSCPARHPKRENVRFFATGAEAAGVGLRPCLRCRPDEASREASGLDRAFALISSAHEAPALADLAAAAGYSPHHFHRLFTRATGLTPAAFLRARRAQAVPESLERSATVTEALYDAGYSGPARFYADAAPRLGMRPATWRHGGRGETIKWAIGETSLGPMMLAATERGICRLSFDEDETALRARFPKATIMAGGPAMAELLRRAVEAVEQPRRTHDLPLDVRGTAFQEAVWRELSRIPSGETLSYAVLAARAGNPLAVRAAGSACGANQIAVLIPCHRAQRGDGSLGGYAYGVERKRTLLARESRDRTGDLF